jgi:hypothetical protein
MAENIVEKSEECKQLKNIKYKNMLLTGNVLTQTIQATKKANIDMFLEKESNLNRHEPWNKLDKTDKIKVLIEYVNLSAINFSLSEAEVVEYRSYLVDSLDKKKLQHVKDVQYDNQTGKIIIIPNLHFNPTSRKFTFKRNEKRASTVKSLGNGKARGGKKSASASASVAGPGASVAGAGAGASVAGASVAGASVAGASVAGASVAGPGASVAGASVAGASVAGASVAGASVAGASQHTP